jgi:hypothetical protein
MILNSNKMKILFRWAFLISFFFLTSCEEVIDLDLGDTPPQINIEGMVSTDPGPYTVKITESVNYNERNIFPPVSGALVTIGDVGGRSEVLEEREQGVYYTSNLRGQKGKTYRTEVEIGGKKYSAVSTIPRTVIPINSISYEFVEESFFNDEGYYLTVYFSDPSEEVNYYRLKIFVNGEPYLIKVEDNLVKDDNFWLINDKFFNGKMIDFEFPFPLKAEDVVNIELHQLDQVTFNYYRTLVELMGAGGVAPSNPLTNWSNGALGYFGALSISYGSITIKE